MSSPVASVAMFTGWASKKAPLMPSRDSTSVGALRPVAAVNVTASALRKGSRDSETAVVSTPSWWVWVRKHRKPLL